MKITFVPDLKNRLRDCLRDVKAEQVEDAQSKKIESASFVEKYFQDLRAKEGEEKEQEEDQINEEQAAHSISIDSGNEGDNESVMDEAAAFAQFKKAMDFHLLAKEAEDKKRDQFQINSEGWAKPITIDLDSESDNNSVVIKEIDPPKRPTIRFHHNLWAKDGKEKKNQHNQINTDCTANLIIIGSDSESDDIIEIGTKSGPVGPQ